MRILVIEDDPIKYENIEAVLLEYFRDADIDWVNNRWQGLMLFEEENNYDLVVTDNHLPNHKGYSGEESYALEIIDDIREINPIIPIIVCSARIIDDLPKNTYMVLYEKEIPYENFTTALYIMRLHLESCEYCTNNCSNRNNFSGNCDEFYSEELPIIKELDDAFSEALQYKKKRK